MGHETPQLRRFRPENGEQLASLYRESVRCIGSRYYDAAQVEAWASFAEDSEGFIKVLSDGATVPAWDGVTLASIGQLYPQDHIALLYTAPAYARRGYGRAVYQDLERIARSLAIATLYTEASRASRSFFEDQGFLVDDVEYVERNGLFFERFRMCKHLNQ